MSILKFKQILHKINMSILWDILPVPLVIILLMLVLFCTGCTSKPEPIIKVVTQQVSVPLLVKCIDKQDFPVYSSIVKTEIYKSDTTYVKTKKLIIRDKEYQQFANMVVPLLENCIKD